MPKHRYTTTFVRKPAARHPLHRDHRCHGKKRGCLDRELGGSYTPDVGKEKEARDALSGIYQSGLDAIRAKLDY